MAAAETPAPPPATAAKVRTLGRRLCRVGLATPMDLVTASIALAAMLAILPPAFAQQLPDPVLATTDQIGQWDVLDFNTGVVCIHSALLPNSRILCIERPHTSPYPGNPNTANLTSTVIDLLRGPKQALAFPLAYNAFCNGHAQAADGSIFVVGGDKAPLSYPNGTTFLFDGRKRQRFFTPSDATTSDVYHQGTWDETASMSSQRWYPTVVIMADG
ncbi:hypothetical protein HK405_000913, partial [Cladochytrium tenue]